MFSKNRKILLHKQLTRAAPNWAVHLEIPSEFAVLSFVNAGNVTSVDALLGRLNCPLTLFSARTCKSKYGGFLVRRLGTHFVVSHCSVNVIAYVMEKCAQLCKEALVGGSEKRKHRRLSVNLDLSYRKVDSTDGTSHRGCTLNAGPGGLYFQTPAGPFKPGSLLQVELSIPPTAGILEFGGRISGFAKVLRVERGGVLSPGGSSPAGGCGVAVQFCGRPTLSM